MFQGLSNVRGTDLPFVADFEAHLNIVTEHVVSPIKYTTIIPDGLKPEIVAPLLCGEFWLMGSCRDGN